jgi:TolA-binding protein
VASFITENFIPVRIHIKEQPQSFERFSAQWTPTIIILDSDATERHRFEGYMPAEEFLAQLELGLAKIAFARQQWSEAEQRYREIAEKFPNSEVAPEALYWAGVAKYKGTNDPSALGETAQAFKQKYPESVWAKKSSVWAA